MSLGHRYFHITINRVDDIPHVVKISALLEMFCLPFKWQPNMKKIHNYVFQQHFAFSEQNPAFMSFNNLDNVSFSA